MSTTIGLLCFLVVIVIFAEVARTLHARSVLRVLKIQEFMEKGTTPRGAEERADLYLRSLGS